MDQADRDRVIEAAEAWHDAEDAYREHNDKHYAVWWTESDVQPSMPEPITKESMVKRKELREEADARREEFDALASSLGLL